MRTIKYQAWIKDEKRMISPLVVKIFNDGDFVVREYDGKVDNTYYFEDGNVELMEYTGLKDVNGTEIYEGDIIEGETHRYGTEIKNPYFYRGAVRFEDNGDFLAWWIDLDGDGGGNPLWHCVHRNDTDRITGKIIGNVHENPNLMKDFGMELLKEEIQI